MKKKLYITAGAVLIVYILALNLMSGTKIAFSGPVLIFAVFLIIYAYKSEDLLRFINKRRITNKALKMVKIGCAVVLIGLLIIEGIIVTCPKKNTENSDYILVLGAGLRNGTEPSLTLAYRLDAAKECIDSYKNSGKIVVSGGKGSDEKLAESEAMKKYLVQHGISEDRILIENKSSTTSENFKFSKDIIESDSGRSIDEVNVKIVTTGFHAFRSRILAMKNGYKHVTNYSSPTVWYLIPVNYVRESFAVVKSVLFD